MFINIRSGVSPFGLPTSLFSLRFQLRPNGSSYAATRRREKSQGGLEPVNPCLYFLESLKLLVTTDTLLKAMAKAARMGCSSRSIVVKGQPGNGLSGV
jgi:hypothetical protein